MGPVGHALLYALGLARLRWSDARLLGLSYLAGWAFLGSALSLALIAGIGPGIPAVCAVSAVLVVGCAVAGRGGAAVPPVPKDDARHPLAVAATGVGAAIVGLAGLAALGVSFRGDYAGYWDVIAFWIPKAETVYYGLDPGVWGSLQHPEYPPLLPTTYAASFNFGGGFHPSLLPFQCALLGVAFLGAVPALLGRFTPSWITLPALALLATTPWFWWRMQAPAGDQPLAYLIAVAAIACVMWLYEPRRAWLGLAFTFLAAATLTKLEGVFLAGLLIAIVLPAGLALHRRAALPVLVLLAAPPVIVPWRLWLGHHGLPTSAADFHPSDLLSPGFLADRTDRLARALDYLVRSPLGQLEAGALVCIAAGTLLAVAYRIPVITAAVAAWLALACLGLATIYWIGRFEISFYLDSSANRVGTTVIIVAATLSPLLLGMALERDGRDAEPDST